MPLKMGAGEKCALQKNEHNRELGQDLTEADRQITVKYIVTGVKILHTSRSTFSILI